MVNIKMNMLGFTKRRACEVTAEELQMSESSIKNYILNYREYGVGGLYDRPKSGAPPIYDSDVIDAAIADLEPVNPTLAHWCQGGGFGSLIINVIIVSAVIVSIGIRGRPDLLFM